MITGPSSYVLWVLFRAVLLLAEFEARHLEQICTCLKATALGLLGKFNASGREIFRGYPPALFRHVHPRAPMGCPGGILEQDPTLCAITNCGWRRPTAPCAPPRCDAKTPRLRTQASLRSTQRRKRVSA